MPNIFRGCLFLLCLGILFWPVKILYAADPAGVADVFEDDFDDLLDAFDDGDFTPQETSPETPLLVSKRSYRIGGELSLSAAGNFAHDQPQNGQTGWLGLSRLRSMLAMEFDAEPSDILELHVSCYGFYDFAYEINGRDQYAGQVLETYEKELELTETYALLNPVPSIDFRFGRQIVVWGGSDNIRVTDILNPLDLREPGLTDLEYIRLPVTMSRLDYLGYRRRGVLPVRRSPGVPQYR